MANRKALAAVFGEVVRELRLERGLTQDQLAEEAKTERSHISALERAEKGPSLATIFTIAPALGMSASELITQIEHRIASKKR